MPDAGWKKLERRVAALFGGQRRGADYGGKAGGKSDVIAPTHDIAQHLAHRLVQRRRPGHQRALLLALPFQGRLHLPRGCCVAEGDGARRLTTLPASFHPHFAL